MCVSLHFRYRPRRQASAAALHDPIEHRRLPAVLAGSLKSEKFFPHGLRKFDEGKLRLIEKVVVPALVDDPHEIVLGGSCIWQNSIDLAEDQRGLVPTILEAQRKLFRRACHGLSK